jgi:uncharacterized protein (DUF1778 family)
MYPDPKRIRNHRVMLRLSEYELDYLASMANYQGDALATFLRELVLREAAAVLRANHAYRIAQQAA